MSHTVSSPNPKPKLIKLRLNMWKESTCIRWKPNMPANSMKKAQKGNYTIYRFDIDNILQIQPELFYSTNLSTPYCTVRSL